MFFGWPTVTESAKDVGEFNEMKEAEYLIFHRMLTQVIALCPLSSSTTLQGMSSCSRNSDIFLHCLLVIHLLLHVVLEHVYLPDLPLLTKFSLPFTNSSLELAIWRKYIDMLSNMVEKMDNNDNFFIYLTGSCT